MKAVVSPLTLRSRGGAALETDGAFAIEVDALAHRIYQDMNGEEAELLDADLLRDDVVAIDQTCG